MSVDSDKVVVTTTWRTQSFHQRHGTQLAQMSHSSNNVLRARRGVIRMLIIVVLTFALCNLPYHARKMWQYWWVHFRFVLHSFGKSDWFVLSESCVVNDKSSLSFCFFLNWCDPIGHTHTKVIRIIRHCSHRSHFWSPISIRASIHCCTHSWAETFAKGCESW